MAEPKIPNEMEIVERLRQELAKSEPSKRKRVIEKFVLAALGSIPWVGGFLSAARRPPTFEQHRDLESNPPKQGDWTWMTEYNEMRPHDSPGDLTPAEFRQEAGGGSTFEVSAWRRSLGQHP